MPRVLPHALVIVLLFAMVLPASAQDMQVIDRVIVIVDDEIILESEVLQYVQDIVLRNRDAYRSEAELQRLRENVLQELINQKILLSLAEQDTNIVVEDRQVDMTLDDRLSQVTREVGGEEALEDYYGKPMRQIRRDFREQVRNSMLIDRVRNRQMNKVSVTKDEVETFYDQYEDELPTMPERVRLAHILIEIEPAEEALNRAKSKADSLFQQLIRGADFDSLAMEHSDDRASASKGGLLGTTQRGDLVPEYEAVAYQLEEGEISEPVRSRFGYHIIRLNWRRGEKINTNHILVMLQATKDDEQRAMEQARLLKRQVENGAPFDSLARAESDDKETANLGGDLGWFDVGSIPQEFQRAASGLAKGEVSEPFQSRVGVHVVTVSERDDARPVDLRKDWERISQMARREKQEKVYSAWLEDQRDEVYIELVSE